MMLPLAAISIFWHVMIVLWILVAAALILVVLLQKGRGGGLAAAFGGAGAGSLLGTKTGDFLTWITIGLVAVFLTMSVLMGLFMRPIATDDLLGLPAPIAAPAESAAGGEQPLPVAPVLPQPEAAQPVETPAAQPAAPAAPAVPTVPAAPEQPAK